MKKYLIVLMAVLTIGIASFGQAGRTALKSVYGNLTDTVVNSGTKYLYSAAKINGSQPVVTAVITMTELTGTTGGTVTIEASVDGTNWYSYYGGIESSSVITSTYTFTPADVSTQTFRFKLTSFRDSYIRIKYVGTGTMQDIISGYLLY